MGISNYLCTISKEVNPVDLFMVARQVITEYDPDQRTVKEQEMRWPYESDTESYRSLSLKKPSVLNVYWFPGQKLGRMTGHEDMPEWRVMLWFDGALPWEAIADVGDWFESQKLHWWWWTDTDDIVHDGPHKTAIARGLVPYPDRTGDA